MPAPSAAVPAAPALADEIAALEGARTALVGADPSRALALLDAYDRRPGALAHEATALRVEAFVMRGDHSNATKVARSFVAQHPKSPLAPRMRALTHLEDETTIP
jgi:hypothetical protein